MKKILRGRKLLTFLLAAITIVVLTVCAHAAMIEEPEAPQTPEEFWDAVRDLELSLWDDPRAESESMNEPRGYESLLPQIEELVKSYANYEEGSLHYKDGVLVWRSDGMTCGYSPAFRERMERIGTEAEQAEDPFEPKGISRSLLRNLGSGAEIQGTGFNSGSTPDGVVDVCAFVPYDGTEKNNFAGHKDFGEVIKSYTGGTSTFYGGTDADIDTLAKALEECAVVVIGSHGTGSGAIGLTTNTGLTTDDYTDDHTIFFGIYYKSGSTEEDYRLWSIDGTVIANHMTKDAPNNLLISSSCEFMKNDAMCAPLRDKGVAVVYGYSESVISASADQFEHALIDALSRGMTMADAIVDMRETVGCAWDTYYRHLSYEEVQQSGVAFPIVVSAEDEYPGEGNVNFVQTVGSTWKLPLKADLAGKYVIGLNESVSLVLAETGDPVTAASVASGSLPAGMTLSASGNQVLLTGTPTAAGKSSFTLSFSTASEGNRNREEEILVADYANAHTSSQTESWTARDVSMFTISPLTSNTGDQHEIKCALGTSEQIDTVQIPESSLDDSLRVVLEGGEVFIRTFKDTTYSWGLGEYHVTPPGEYDVTLDCITKDGKVFRHKVGITVTARHIYSYDDDETYATKHLTLSYTATKGSECETNVRTGWLLNGQYVRWHDWYVKDFEVTGGSLPDGLYLTHGTVRPFGIYGTPTEAGEFTITCRVTGYYDIYEYKLTVTVEDAWTVSFETGGGTVWMTQSVKDGGKAHLPLSDPEKTGYTFTGWYADAGCTTEFDFSQTITEDTTVYAGWSPWTYDVIWKNDDGTVLEKDKNVTYGDTPSYDGATPEKPATAQYAYTFSGWTPEVTDAPDIEKDGDTFVYTAQYDSTVRSYTVTWVIDGAEETETYEYGKTPTHADPEKEATAQYTYTFKEWSPAIETVTGDATYTAVFDCTINTYTVLWLNEDGTELEKDEDVPYGETPSYDGADPEKPATAQYTYTFAGWDPEISAVTGDATYTAVFDATLNHYTVTWVIDGRMETEDYAYGETPWHENPTKAGALSVYYVFNGWTPAVESVTGDAVYTAVFERHVSPLFPDYAKLMAEKNLAPSGEPASNPPSSETPAKPVLPFTDVSPYSPFYDDIVYVYENDIMNGMSDTEFSENLPLTRGMIVTILWRVEGRPEVTYSGVFTDVPAGEWFTDGVEWAASHGIVLGYGNGKYGPTDPVTREQLAAILFRYANWKGFDTSVGEDTNILSYDDAFTWGDWAVPALQWACGTGVLEDVPAGMLRPTEPATRGEIAHAIRVFCEEVAK